MTTAAPFVSREMEVEKDWIDYNGHMNMAYYNVLFDRAADDAFEALGMGPHYAANRKLTVYTAEIHVRYLREVHLGDRVTVAIQIIDHDDKRMHVFKELRHAEGWVSATSETLYLHIDMAGPKVAPFPADVRDLVDAMAADHAGLPRPDAVGRSIGIVRK